MSVIYLIIEKCDASMVVIGTYLAIMAAVIYN